MSRLVYPCPWEDGSTKALPSSEALQGWWGCLVLGSHVVFPENLRTFEQLGPLGLSNLIKVKMGRLREAVGSWRGIS